MAIGDLKLGYALVCATVLVLATGVTGQQRPSLLHKPAPEFVRSDLGGRNVDLKQYRGKVVLLNFWATWCAPCQIELPRFAAWQKKYASDGFQVLAVSMDDTEAPVRRTVRRLRLNFPVIMGDPKLGESYGGVLGLPRTFVLDRNGRIAAEFKGDTDLAVMEAQIKRIAR